MKALCIGQAAYDITLPVDSFPVENKKVRIDNKVECGGGSAMICAYLLAKWGVETYFAGIVGNDYHGGKIEEELKSTGVNTKYLQKSNQYKTTSSYIIANVTKGTRTILTKKDSNLVMDMVDINENFDVILMDGYEKDIALKVIEKNPKAIKVLDAGSCREDRIELAHYVDYIVGSKDFAEGYSGLKIDYSNMQTIIDIYKLLEHDFSGKIIITLEDKGCFVKDNTYKLVSSLKMKAVDSTGAGDIFHGAFTYCVLNQYDLIKTLKMSNIAGALSVKNIGAQNSIPKLNEVLETYDTYCKE